MSASATRPAPVTRADRLNAICARLGPRARYVIRRDDAGGAKIVIHNPLSGDSVGGHGATMDEAIAMLDAKVPQAPAATK